LRPPSRPSPCGAGGRSLPRARARDTAPKVRPWTSTAMRRWAGPQIDTPAHLPRYPLLAARTRIDHVHASPPGGRWPDGDAPSSAGYASRVRCPRFLAPSCALGIRGQASLATRRRGLVGSRASLRTGRRFAVDRRRSFIEERGSRRGQRAPRVAERRKNVRTIRSGAPWLGSFAWLRRWSWRPLRSPFRPPRSPVRTLRSPVRPLRQAGRPLRSLMRPEYTLARTRHSFMPYPGSCANSRDYFRAEQGSVAARPGSPPQSVKVACRSASLARPRATAACRRVALVPPWARSVCA
jgi:hypothetical protein